MSGEASRREGLPSVGMLWSLQGDKTKMFATVEARLLKVRALVQCFDVKHADVLFFNQTAG